MLRLGAQYVELTFRWQFCVHTFRSTIIGKTSKTLVLPRIGEYKSKTLSYWSCLPKIHGGTPALAMKPTYDGFFK